MKKNICVVTTTRAEYGILSSLISKIKEDKLLNLKLVVSGTHFSTYFGNTYKEIDNDGFKKYKRIDILEACSSLVSITKSMGKTVSKFGEYFSKSKIDAVVVLGDRYEILSIVSAACICNIPIIHLHGGELTFGAIDDSMRHAITKMSHLHFVSTDEHKKRVIQLGENPKTVFDVGALGIDNIKNIKLMSKKELEASLDLNFSQKNLLVTFHPETLGNKNPEKQIKELFIALDKLKNTTIIFTKSNADLGADKINSLIDKYVKNKKSMHVFASLGKTRYLSTLKYIDAVIGNSSSGIIEVPSFKIGTINIGDRQKGRIKAKSVINCLPNYKSISKAIDFLYSNRFQKALKRIKNPYGEGNTSSKMINIIKKIDFNKIIQKEFYDI